MCLSLENMPQLLKCKAATILNNVQETWQQPHLLRVLVKLMWAQRRSTSRCYVGFWALWRCHEVSVTRCPLDCISDVSRSHLHFTLHTSLVSVHLKLEVEAVYVRSCVLMKKQSSSWLHQITRLILCSWSSSHDTKPAPLANRKPVSAKIWQCPCKVLCKDICKSPEYKS